jgi:sugar lactone lactonase YvrE
VAGSSGQVIPNFSRANLALGQPTCTSTVSVSSATAASLSRPRGVVVDATTRKVFVADTENNRVLRDSSAAALNTGANAEAVLGQSTFAGVNLNSPTANLGMQKPSAIFLDTTGRLWVADTFNHRVLMFADALTSAHQPAPSKVLGQADLATTTPPTAPAANRLISPSSIWVDTSDRLWVVAAFNRVLRFDAVTRKANGANADGVLGQPNFTTSTARTTDSTTIRTSIGKATLGSSLAVSATGTLFVAARFENRVLRFDNAGTLANNAAASSVLGQPNFTLSASTRLVDGMNINGSNGFSITIAANDTLWVSDTGNNRVLRFDVASTKSIGAYADGVLGHADFTSSDPKSGGDPKRLYLPRGLFFDGVGSLWVADTLNNRVVRFSAAPPVVETVKPVLTLGKFVKSTKAAMITLKGTASDASGIKDVSYRFSMGQIKLATGTTNWRFKANLRKGINKVRIFATDTKGNVSLTKVITIKRR